MLIRGWKKLKLYCPGRNQHFESIEHIFAATIKWRLIEQHYPYFIRLALAIHGGTRASS